MAGADRKSALIGESDNAKRLRETYNNEADAAADWKWIQRGAAMLGFTLGLGRADLYPEQRLRLSGFKPEIDDATRLIAKTIHSITGSGGCTTQLELETGPTTPHQRQ